MNVPTAATTRQDAVGRGTRKMAGSTTPVNRSARNSSGGTPSMPHSMTTKLKPQITATSVARREWRTLRVAGMGDSLGGVDHEAPAIRSAPNHVASLHDGSDRTALARSGAR